MVSSFKDAWLHDFFVEDKHTKKIPAGIRKRLFRKLQILDDATSSADLRSPPSNHFERLAGNLNDKYSIRVNDQWRLIFAWDESRGEAQNVYLDDHSYR